MSSSLCPTIPHYFASAADAAKFFNEHGEQETIQEHEKREQPKFNVPGESCKSNLFFGFFFGGT